MRTIIFKYAITGVIAIATLTAFAQGNKGTEEATKQVTKANKNLSEAKVDFAADYQKFKKNSESKIADNQKKIEALKEKKENYSNQIREEYTKKVLALQQKNNYLKDKIEEADTTKTSRWSSFKREFNHDMDELGRSIKDVGVDNTK